MTSTSLSKKQIMENPTHNTCRAKTRNAREGRNPATGETIKIPEKTSAAFKPATALKDI